MVSLTNILVALMILSFIVQSFIPEYQDAFIFVSDRALFDPWRFFTANFLHFNIFHLFLNTYSLYVIGNALETKIKKSDLLKILFLGSFLIYLEMWLAYSYDFGIYNIGLGASGGVAALLAAAAILMPEDKVKVLIVPAKIKHLAIIFFAFEIIMFAIGDMT